MNASLKGPPQGEQIAGHEVSAEDRAPAGRDSRHDTSHGILLAELAGLDELLRERDAIWKRLVRHVDGLRREIAVTRAQAQRHRSLTARDPPRDEDDQGASPSREGRDTA